MSPRSQRTCPPEHRRFHRRTQGFQDTARIIAAIVTHHSIDSLHHRSNVTHTVTGQATSQLTVASSPPSQHPTPLNTSTLYLVTAWQITACSLSSPTWHAPSLIKHTIRSTQLALLLDMAHIATHSGSQPDHRSSYPVEHTILFVLFSSSLSSSQPTSPEPLDPVHRRPTSAQSGSQRSSSR